MAAEFVHLHNHTEYSLLDGACRLTDGKGNPSELFHLIADEYKMPALAITDHGNMYGAMEFYWAAKKSGIKPIIGCEVYVAPKSRYDKAPNDKNEESKIYNHLILLAKNFQGYLNLMQIVSAGFLEGFYYKPRVDKEILRKYSEGIICLSGCISGEVQNKLLRNKSKEAIESAIEHREIFGKDNYYLEIMDHGLEDQRIVIPGLIELSKTTGIPLVATNDCHFLRKDDWEAHDVLICIGTKKLLSDVNRMRYPELVYYRSAEEMAELFSYAPQAIKNTLEIAEKINFEIKTDRLLLPSFPVPAGFESDNVYLEKLCREGLERRYGNVTQRHKDRLEHELSVIKKMGFASYFLIVSDFVQYAKDNDISVGPGRGSGAGSMVSYTLGITNICPLQYGLLFERFLNPDRKTMPDLDIDFADTGRDKVMDYVRQRYGEEKCAQIISFGSLQARQAIKDVARAMDFTPAQSNEIAKLIPQNNSIEETLAETQDLKKLINSDNSGRMSKLVNFAKKLEGLKRHPSVHAAGMVIANDDIVKYSPLAKDVKNNIITTQYDGDILPRLGLLKMDFLAIKTLSVIVECVKLIKQQKDKEFNIDAIPLNDVKTYALLSKAKSLGVFQLEKTGLRNYMRKFKPETVEDIIALTALYRPGPMKSGMLDDFIERKHNKKRIEYDHPLQEPILKETYGIILYQEQAMRMAIDLAGFTPGQADDLRKAMSKKVLEVIAAKRQQFIDGVANKGIKKRIADKIYSNIEAFAGYGFNKSHAAAYGVLAYRTAYLKANYPLEYIASMLNAQIGRPIKPGDEDGFVAYLEDAKDFGIDVLHPNVQYSRSRFSIENGNIRFGLLAIKSVGDAIAESIEKARGEGGEFKDWNDFLERIDLKSANKSAFEALTKAGAFDCFAKEGEDKFLLRSKILNGIEYSLSAAARIKAEKASAQGMLFGDESAEKIVLPSNVAPLGQREILEYEKSVLGFYLSGHPLAPVLKDIEKFSDYRLDGLPLPEDEGYSKDAKTIRLAGMIASVKKTITKREKREMAKIVLEDLHSSVEAIVFPQTFEQYGKYLTQDAVVVIKGKLAGTEEKKEIHINEIIPYEQAKHMLKAAKPRIYINIENETFDDKMQEKLKEILKKHLGEAQVSLIVNDKKDGKYCIDTEYKCNAQDDFVLEIGKEIGDESAVEIRYWK
jgi:DNA polymerase-3 subunit alpha